MTPVTPVASVASFASTVSSALNIQAAVKTTDPVLAGTTNIPSGTNGTVIAVLGVGSTYEIAFGPPVSTTETVPQNLLAIA